MRGTISTFHALSSGMEREVGGIFLLWDNLPVGFKRMHDQITLNIT